MKNQHLLSALVLLGCLFLLPYCSATRGGNAQPAVSFEKDLLPIMERSCTPCHFPDRGRKKLLHTAEATRETLDDIIRRIELPADAEDYMPFKSKRPALTAEEIDLFKQWATTGMSD